MSEHAPKLLGMKNVPEQNKRTESLVRLSPILIFYWRAWVSVLELVIKPLALILLLPQIFILLYCSWSTVNNPKPWSMLTDLLLLGFTLSRFVAPALYLFYLLMVRINRNVPQSLLSFALCMAFGYGCIVAWNVIIFDNNFSLGWCIIPILLCSGITAFQLRLEYERK